ncbi:MAG TPA: Na/Pi cotransporter family protein [Kiloniellaceae bacterium]|nr:Na/Pi cotransporter family protein [Kiloniellaceae bacterium]
MNGPFHLVWRRTVAGIGAGRVIRRIFLPTIFVVLTFGFWVSPDFRVISAGVAIFLFGMISLEEGFRAFSGGHLERLLNRTTDGLWKSISFGVVSTAVMQSSSLVSVLTISFLSAELIGLASGIGIIFGANIGTTTGAWLVAGLGLKVNIAAYAMPMLVFGVLLIFQSSRTLKGVGYVLAGLGFLFLGIHYMKEGFTTFKEAIDLSQFAISGFKGLVIFLLIGTMATVVMQSSHATLVLIVTALAAGQITYENAIALAIGANVGTTITAILGALGANAQGKQLAAGHLIFNVLTGAVAVVFIHQFAWAVDFISRNIGIDADDYTLKLAVFHSLFNVVGVLLMVPLIGRLVAFLELLFVRPEEDRAEPRYLNTAVLEVPDALLAALRNEALHLFDNAFEIIAHALSLHRHTILSSTDLKEFVAKSSEVIDFDLDSIYDRKVKTLHAAILDFISRAQPAVSGANAEQLNALRETARLIVECVKDAKHLRKNMLRFIASDNQYIQTEYNVLRVRLGTMLRDIYRLRDGTDPELDVFDLDELKLEMESTNIIVDGTLERLIREARITAVMGSSLMNDMGYGRSLAWNLAEIGKMLFGATDYAASDAETLVTLDKEEIERLAETGPEVRTRRKLKQGKKRQ